MKEQHPFQSTCASFVRNCSAIHFKTMLNLSNRNEPTGLEICLSGRRRWITVAALLPLPGNDAAADRSIIPKEAEVIASTGVTTPARRSKPRTTAALHELLERIESEYREMPALSVTEAQAQRLWGLNSTTCSFVLMTLIQRGILKRTASGTYVRR